MSDEVLTDEWLDARIAKIKALIEAYEQALLDLAAGAIFQYSFDTGQTRQTVTKQNLGSLRLFINTLYNTLATLEARRYGGGVRVLPSF